MYVYDVCRGDCVHEPQGICGSRDNFVESVLSLYLIMDSGDQTQVIMLCV